MHSHTPEHLNSHSGQTRVHFDIHIDDLEAEVPVKVLR